MSHIKTIVTDEDKLTYHKKDKADENKIYFIYELIDRTSTNEVIHKNSLSLKKNDEGYIETLDVNGKERTDIAGIFNIDDPLVVTTEEDTYVEFDIPIEFNVPIQGKTNQYTYGDEGKSACTIIAIQAAISLLKQDNLNRPLLEEMIDVSIKEGVDIYINEVVPKLAQLAPGEQHTGLSTGLNAFNKDINFNYNKPFSFGVNLAFFQQELPFNKVLFNNLKNDNAMIIICQFETISITRKENIYYYFDSHPKAGFNENGVIIPFDKLETLIDFLNNQRFIKTDGVVILYNTINYTTFTLK